jgi:hypothetical protein
MIPYQIYQVLTDQRLRDLKVEARRREQITAARRVPGDLTEPSSRLKDAAARILALLHVRQGVGDRSISAAGAGPMGCAA